MTTPGSRRTCAALLGIPLLAVCLLGAGWASWHFWRSPSLPGPAGPPAEEAGGQGPDVPDDSAPPDPRGTYAGPYRNVRPDVAHVGSERCATCHAGIAARYAGHPMGRSLAPIADLAGRQDYRAARVEPARAFGWELSVERDGNRVTHRQSRPGPAGPLELAHEVHYAVGSGARGHSYLHVRDGFVFQTPVSWFTQEERWDLSPGFSPVMLTGRLLETNCLHCHANRVRPLAGHDSRFESGVFDGHAIGCERCHGPGEAHASRHEEGRGGVGKFDETIVNPSRLPWRLRDAVCEQCHLQGEARLPRRGRDWFDYRPGLPLEDFLAVFVPRSARQDHRAVGHFEQMRQSACFQRSPDEGKLGCVSCHDPHEKVAPRDRESHFRARCLVCHQERGCKLHLAERWRLVPGDACTACHMPRAASNIVHVAVTDHRIPRRPLPPAEGPAPGRPAEELVNWHTGPVGGEDLERRRDRALAMLQSMVNRRPGPAQAREWGKWSEAVLEQSTTRHPRDRAAWHGLGDARMWVQKPADAVRAFEQALRLGPRRADTLLRLAGLQQSLGEYDRAIATWKRFLAVSPHLPEPREQLAALLAERGDLAGAGEHVDVLLQLDPGNPIGRRIRLRVLAGQGDLPGARRELAVLEALGAPDTRALGRWLDGREKR